MRKVEESTRSDGQTLYRVRFRHAGKQTSKTFHHHPDAATFAAIMDSGGVAEALAWLDARESTAPDTWTFAEWFEHYVKHLTGITARTRDDYRAQRRRYLSDLDAVPLGQLSRTHVAGVVNSMERAGLSPKTIKNAVNMLSSCLAAAVDEGHLTRNPVRGVRLPREAVTEDDDDGELTFLTHEEFNTLLRFIPDQYAPLVVFLVGSGMRWSEATALRARDVDLTAGTVKVRRAWKRVPGDGFAIGPPKTKKSRRTTNPGAQAIEAIRYLLGKPGDYVFTTSTGKPVLHANFHARVWRPAVIAASVCAEHTPEDCRCATPKVKGRLCPAHGKATIPPCGCVGTVPHRPGIHALRHTYASWMISRGAPLELVQDQMGHESILTTRGTYGHLLPAFGAQAAQAATEALAAALGGGPFGELGHLRAAPTHVANDEVHVLAVDGVGDRPLRGEVGHGDVLD